MYTLVNIYIYIFTHVLSLKDFGVGPDRLPRSGWALSKPRIPASHVATDRWSGRGLGEISGKGAEEAPEGLGYVANLLG